ncbi:hypothetical protein CK203_018049 [Vitis vinifera]|uniref:Uncharacterized protein n=1 Tax=Vitis vinifera TaxID=29760 RepID=A0A438JW08_VITVI|nr:hypothetical protein CK203_018049 [Vitis vinifera]
MWLKAEGFKELIEGWWQGIVVRGKPSYRENKAEALQQVERWDVVEEERALSEEELGHKKTAKEKLFKMGVDGRSALETTIKGNMA